MTNSNKKPTKEELYDLYINQKKTSREIAEMYNLTQDIIKNNLKNYGIRKFNNKPSIEEMKEEADKIANEMLAQNGITHKEEPKPTDNKIIEEFLKETTVEEEYISDTVPLEWQGIFNMITRMYESNEEYRFVKYSRVKNNIEITLDKDNFNPKKEYERIKNILNYDSLKYSLMEYPKKFTIIVSVKE